jgi:hypothetical protein
LVTRGRAKSEAREDCGICILYFLVLYFLIFIFAV